MALLLCHCCLGKFGWETVTLCSKKRLFVSFFNVFFYFLYKGSINSDIYSFSNVYREMRFIIAVLSLRFFFSVVTNLETSTKQLNIWEKNQYIPALVDADRLYCDLLINWLMPILDKWVLKFDSTLYTALGILLMAIHNSSCNNMCIYNIFIAYKLCSYFRIWGYSTFEGF